MMEAGEHIVNNVSKEAVPQRERLSDEELGNLISAVGNHEAKAFTLLAMREGNIYPMRDLYEEIMQKQGRGGWAFGLSNPFDYCKHSLSPIGLVTKEVLNPVNPYSEWGYIKTEYGRDEGDILAAALLKFSYEHPEFSLIDFFAYAVSHSKQVSTTEGIDVRKRAPITRLRIFWELATSEPLMRETDLAERLGESPAILVSHLRSLKEHGIVNYEATEKDESVSFYQLSSQAPEEQPPVYQNQRSLTSFIYSTLIEQPSVQWTADSLMNHYFASHPEQEEKGVKKEGLKRNVSGVLSHFLKHGYTTRGKLSYEYRSEITLTDEQGKAISDLLMVIDRFQNKDSELVKEAKEFKAYLLSHPEAVSTLLRKAKEHSPFANKRPLEESRVDILALVSQSQSPLNNEEIRKALAKVQGRLLGNSAVSLLTFQLTKQGKLLCTTEKGIKKYTINPQSQN